MKTGEELPEADEVYRIVVSTHRDRKNKKIPAVRCFSLSPHDENKLSVDWNNKTRPEESIARVGATYRFNKEEYKPFDNRELYAMEVGFLNRLDDVEKVVYDPIQLTSPDLGKVNNPAHSLIVFREAFANDQAKEPETLLKIRDHAKDKKVDVDMEEVERWQICKLAKLQINKSAKRQSCKVANLRICKWANSLVRSRSREIMNPPPEVRLCHKPK